MPENIIVGAPIFSNGITDLPLRSPLGQTDAYQRARREITSGTELMQAQACEWVSVIVQLFEMKIQFQVLSAHERFCIPELLDGLQTKFGLVVARITDQVATDVVRYPRDLATRLPNGTVLIDEDQALALLGLRSSSPSLRFSPFGQGGRLHIRQDIALLYQDLVSGGSNIERWAGSDLKPLRQAGLRIGLLPNAMTYQEERGFRGYVPDSHPDRVCGLLEDQQGKLHLIVHPKVQSGFQGLSRKPRFNTKATLAQIQHVCQPLGIKLHVPGNLTVPGSLCFVQFADGRVLMTGGEPELSQLVRTIVGSEQVFETDVPIQQLPAWCLAGIHCLVNDIPQELLDKLAP